jgi:CelD/BcsL family acetyltransferase involved in cellulose biosynthesis/RimJ/RimL family protein N-acetyltransferase
MTASTLRADPNLQVNRGASALTLLCSADFLQRWKALFDACPWGTCFQLPEYGLTWYDFYQEAYEPLVVHQVASDGSLRGLLLLAEHKQTRNLTFAGAHQAEYQVWLALPGEQDFIENALLELRNRGFSRLQFTYVPTGTPLEWFVSGRLRWGRTSDLRPVRKPLMQVSDTEEIRTSLRKKSNKSRINRLQRRGPLTFQQVQTPDELDAFAESFTLYTDFRQGAAHGGCPFSDDPHKYPFHRALLQYPDLIHVTVLKAGEELIAAHIGMVNRREVTLGIIAHSPFVAADSPGKLLVLYLGLLLSDQGISEFDLTPGGDSYKDRFATHYSEAYQLTVFLDRQLWWRSGACAGCVGAAKESAKCLRLDPRRVVAKASALGRGISRISFSSLVRWADRVTARWLWSTTEMRFYRMTASQAQQMPTDAKISEGSIADLLCYVPFERGQPSKQAFLNSALNRIDKGSLIYSRSEDGLLVHCGWAKVGETKSFITEVQHEYEYPPDSAVLSDYYTHPQYRGRGFYSSSLRQMLHDVAGREGVEFIYIAVLSDNRASRSVIEKTGFEYQGSIIRRKRFRSETYSLPTAHP